MSTSSLASQHYLVTAANADHDLNRMCSRAGFSGSAWLCLGTYTQCLQPRRSVIHPGHYSGGVKLQCRHQRGQVRPTIRAGVIAWKRCAQQGFITQNSTRETNPKNWQVGINHWRQDPLQTEDPFPGWTYFLCSGGLISPYRDHLDLFFTTFTSLSQQISSFSDIWGWKTSAIKDDNYHVSVLTRLCIFSNLHYSCGISNQIMSSYLLSF